MGIFLEAADYVWLLAFSWDKIESSLTFDARIIRTSKRTAIFSRLRINFTEPVPPQHISIIARFAWCLSEIQIASLDIPRFDADILRVGHWALLTGQGIRQDKEDWTEDYGLLHLSFLNYIPISMEFILIFKIGSENFLILTRELWWVFDFSRMISLMME